MHTGHPDSSGLHVAASYHRPVTPSMSTRRPDLRPPATRSSASRSHAATNPCVPCPPAWRWLRSLLTNTWFFVDGPHGHDP